MNKCNKCGYDYSGSGDSAHVCGPIRIQQRTEQEPAAWIHIDPNKPKVKFLEWKENEHGYRGTWIKKPLYLHPPQRTWVGLTNEDMYVVSEEESCSFIAGAKWSEEILKEKNAICSPFMISELWRLNK